MIPLIRMIAVITAGTVIVTSAFAQTTTEMSASTSLIAVRSGMTRKPTVKLEDAQQQARDLLTGAVRHEQAQAYRSPSLSAENRGSRIDPQEQARRLLLGTPDGGKVARVTSKGDKSPSANSAAYSDPQKLAQRMILGAEAATISAQTRSALATMEADSQR